MRCNCVVAVRLPNVASTFQRLVCGNKSQMHLRIDNLSFTWKHVKNGASNKPAFQALMCTKDDAV